jgi:hypothetical protein
MNVRVAVSIGEEFEPQNLKVRKAGLPPLYPNLRGQAALPYLETAQ